MSTLQPVTCGVTGMGGYAAAILDVVEACAAADPPPVRLAAVISSNPAKHAQRVAQLQAKGVRLLPSYEQMLADPAIEAVILPLPINLHLPYTSQALAAGKAVFCEKPAAGCVEDVEGMIGARDAARLPVAIGFQEVYDQATLPIKRALLSRLIGRPRRAAVWGCWPRTDKYYQRADWAGRFKKDGVWVLDSPANNAMAHFINIALFYVGPTEDASARPVHVQAELYRVYPIENFDTCALRVELEGDVTLRVFLTHAARRGVGPHLTIEGEYGRLTWGFEEPVVRMESHGGATLATFQRDKETQRVHMIRRFARLVRGQPDEKIALATLEQSRCHIAVINGASEASRIVNVPESAVDRLAADGGATQLALGGIEDAFAAAAREGRMLQELNLFPWAVRGGEMDLRDYRKFAGPRG